MMSWARFCRIAAAVFTVASYAFSPYARAAVGRTAGSYQVASSGAATYTIPLFAPRGPNDLEPHMALSYSSQGGIGSLGVGWTLVGLSSIYRCTQTYAQDPAPAPVTLSYSDVFCMDGQRLRLTSGSYGDPSSTYQTEIANFSNVTADGTAGNGPSYFEVQGRDGRTYEYGNGGGSQVLASGTTTAWTWLLDRVTDRAGNTMTISYTTGSGTAVPATISWTPSSYGASTYNYTMQFAYGTNVPQSSIYAYVGGTEYSNTSLLTAISVSYSGTTVKKYILSYQQSPTTGRDELTQVQECADSGGTNCLAPTQFTYQSGQIGVSTSAITAFSAAATKLKTHNDFNGDGRKDLAYCIGTPAVIYVAFASASGFGSPVNTGISCTNPVYGDLTGSGKDGILEPNGTDWWYYTWNGSSFTGQDTGLAYDSTASQYQIADVNGDGLPDLIIAYLPCVNVCILNVDVRLNTSSGSSVSFSSTQTQWYTGAATYGGFIVSDTDFGYGTEQYGTLKALDFNGDGRKDLAVETINGTPPNYTVQTYELLSGPSSFTPVLITTGSGASFGTVTFLDFNSDACTDYAFGSTVYVSGCNGTVPVTVGLGSSTVVGAMDWDGDGRTDILVQNGSTIGVYLSEGYGVSALQATSIPYTASSHYFAFDADGDGLDDLGAYAGTVSYYLHNGAGQKPDLLSEVTDGYGNTIKPTYQSLPQSGYTQGTDASYPYENYIGPLYVVNQTTFSDPSSSSGATYQQTHTYWEGWLNLQGRGFAGFEETRTYDSRTGVNDYYFYKLAFPYAGMETAEYYNFPTVTTRYLQDTLAVNELDSSVYNQRFFPYVSNMTVEHKELGGIENGDQIDTTSTNYSFDNYGNATTIATTLTDNDPGSPYVGDSWTTTVTNTPDVDTSTWCLSLLSESQVAYTASSGSPSVPRTRQFTPDLTNCRYTDITTEPSSGSYEVAEALGYDSFGNINSDTTTGIGMTARQSTASWGTTGQFPASITDATNATTQFNYNFSFGLVSGETNPNGLTTSWQYGDGFGRPTQETRPDGTYTVWQYNSCANANGCLFGSNTLAVSHYLYFSDGSLESDGTTTYDQVDRPYASNDMLMGGSTWNRIDTRYDSLGRVAQRSMPCLWSVIADPCPYDTTYAYDGLNRVTQVQRPINENDSALQTTSYAYEGRTTTITDPYGHTRTLIHDVNGWLRQTKDALGYAVTLGYDAAGAKTSATDSLGNTLWTGTYAYGISPFLVGESDMDRGTWGYTIDALGERTAWTDPKGQHFYASYDALSRPLTRTEPDLFTQWTWGSSATSHDIGRLQSVCTGTGSACSSDYYSEGESYDGLGRPFQRTIVLPSGDWAGGYTYTWQYNATTGLLDTLTYPVSSYDKSLELKYVYQNGILQSITDILDSPNVTLWQANAENPAGQITQETFGNGVVTNRSYDAVTHWVASVQSGPGGGASAQNQSFLYDEVGNVTQRQDNGLGLSENFYYDDDYRLSYSTLNGNQNLSLTYDPIGNITSRSDVANGATWSYDPVHLHQVTQAGSTGYQYGYDVNGNVNSRQGSSIAWTSYNYPSGIYVPATGDYVSLVYGPDRRAWYEVTNDSLEDTEVTDHVGNLLDIVEGGETNGGTEFRHYIYAGSEPVAIVTRSTENTFYYLLTDHEGSIAAVTNAAGGTVVGESFTAYGARRNPTTWSGAPSNSDIVNIDGVTRRGYTFQSALAQMGLNDMVGRVQDAITGRFLSADPTLQDPTSPQDYNPYSYVVNNPLTYYDPTGFGCELNATPDGQGGYTYSGGCDIDAPPDPAPDVCTNCFYTPSPESPPTWQEPSTFPAPSGPAPSAPPQPKTPVPPAKCSNGQACEKSPPQQTVQQCLAGGGGPQGSGDSTVQQGLGYAGGGATALEGATDSLLDATSVQVGKAMAGASPFGVLNAPTNAGYAALGSEVQSALEPVATGLQISGYTLGGLSVVADAYNGYNTGGLSGAATGAAFGLIDFGVESSLTATGPLGAAVAVGYSAMGGSKTITGAAATGTAIIGCNAKLGYPLPTVYRQVR